MINDPVCEVYLVDDDPGVLRAISRFLRSAGYEVKTFLSAKAFMEAYRADARGCLVLDVSMPGISGLGLQRWLAEINSPLPIIFLTGQSDVPTSVRAMKQGAVDFLMKPVKDEDLLQAIRDASRKGALERAQRKEAEAVQKKLATLTPRERQVFQHVVSGQLNKQIAGDLGTVEKTIKVHRARVMQKMGAQSLADLVRLAETAGLGPKGPGRPALSPTKAQPPYSQATMAEV
jgi:FixJ family two-component response regulator